MDNSERLQKYLARAGFGSRRYCERLITANRVRVNGKIVNKLGTRVVPGDVVSVDGKIVRPEDEMVYILVHKPMHVVTTVHDPQGRATVLQLIPSLNVRVYPVGRLDYTSTGLLLLTNDGQLAHRLMHPSSEVKKTYRVRVRGQIGPDQLKQLEDGVKLEDGWTAPAKVKLVHIRPEKRESTVDITIHEGRNRQVRRMLKAVGHPVLSLKRIKFGPLRLGKLPSGGWRHATEQEVRALYRAAGLHLAMS